MTSIASMLTLHLSAAATGERSGSRDESTTSGDDFTTLLNAALTGHHGESGAPVKESEPHPENGQIGSQESAAEDDQATGEVPALEGRGQAAAGELTAAHQLLSVDPSLRSGAPSTEGVSADVTTEETGDTIPDAEDTLPAPDSASETTTEDVPAADTTANRAAGGGPENGDLTVEDGEAAQRAASSAESAESTGEGLFEEAISTTAASAPRGAAEHTTDDDGDATPQKQPGDTPPRAAESGAPASPLLDSGARAVGQPAGGEKRPAPQQLEDQEQPPAAAVEEPRSPGGAIHTPAGTAARAPSVSATESVSAAAQAATPTPPAAPTAVQQATPPAAPAAALPASTPVASAAMLSPQLAAPVHQLISKGDGTHTLTLTVSPERLGPVTVQAHIHGEKVRIELFSAMEMGRETLRSVLTDLRRDLAGLGMSTGNTVLTVSDSESPSGHTQGQQNRHPDQHHGPWVRHGAPEQRGQQDSDAASQGAAGAHAQITNHLNHRIQGESLDLFA